MDFQVSAELIAIYLEDARGHLASLDQGLLGLEREGISAEVVGSLLGPLHTLKGNSGMMGFGSIKDYVHKLEDVLARIRDGAVTLGSGAFDCLFAGVSELRDAVEKACQEGHETRDLAPERGELEGLLTGRLRGKATGPATAPITAPVATVAPPGPAPVTPGPPGPAHVTPGPPGPAPVTPGPPSSKTGEAAPVRSNMVRVDFGRLDHLLNLVGELIVYRTKLQQAGRSVTTELAADPAVRDLLDAVHQLTAVSTQLQETIMDVRMLPIRNV